MKESKLRQVITCAKCHRKIGECPLPLFYRVTVERYGIDFRAVQRKAGLEDLLGGGSVGAVLASAIGPDEDLATPLMSKGTITICEECAGVEMMTHELAEMVNEQENQRKAQKVAESE